MGVAASRFFTRDFRGFPCATFHHVDFAPKRAILAMSGLKGMELYTYL